jgi:hypothetical protein
VGRAIADEEDIGMKLFTLLSLAGLAVLTAGLAATNPGPDAYFQYAQDKVGTYLTEEVCTELPEALQTALAGQCGSLVASLQPEVGRLIRDRTERLNLGVASLYRTTLEIPEMPFLPGYRAETLGILKQFFTYRVGQVA